MKFYAIYGKEKEFLICQESENYLLLYQKKYRLILNGLEMTVTGKYGTLQQKIPQHIIIQENEGLIYVSLKNEREMYKALHGLYRTLISNMITGVSEQFNLTLMLKGVGYRAAVQGEKNYFKFRI